jgi:hypothetical protein
VCFYRPVEEAPRMWTGLVSPQRALRHPCPVAMALLLASHAASMLIYWALSLGKAVRVLQAKTRSDPACSHRLSALEVAGFRCCKRRISLM